MRTKKQHHDFSVCQFELQIQGLQVYKQGFPLCCVKVMRNRESKKNYTKMVIERKNKITEENRFALLDCVRKTKKKTIYYSGWKQRYWTCSTFGQF